MFSGGRCLGSFKDNAGSHIFPEGDQQLSRQGNDQCFPNSATIELYAVPDEVARRLRWYRRHVMPRLGADQKGHLFVSDSGRRKRQETISKQITDALANHVGIHMTPHQFRHFGATSYLERHPEDFETARALLGHASTKTTRIYAGSSSRRASRAYNQHLLAQREALKLMRSTRQPRGSNP